jgi:hypothetical protein
VAWERLLLLPRALVQEKALPLLRLMHRERPLPRLLVVDPSHYIFQLLGSGAMMVADTGSWAPGETDEERPRNLAAIGGCWKKRQRRL